MEVLVEILLALLVQPSHLIRQVARSVFSHVCAHLTPRALQLILDVSWGLWGKGSQEVAVQAPGLPHQPLVLTGTCRVRGGLITLLLCSPDPGGASVGRGGCSLTSWVSLSCLDLLAETGLGKAREVSREGPVV